MTACGMATVTKMAKLQDTEGPLVLIAEDDPATADLLTELIESLHCRVETVHNGRDALRMLATVVPQLVVTDIMMPYISGLEVISEMRVHRLTCDIPVLVMSAVCPHSLPNGNVHYLAKPFNINDLIDAVVALAPDARAS